MSINEFRANYYSKMFISCRWVYKSAIKIYNGVSRISLFPAKNVSGVSFVESKLNFIASATTDENLWLNFSNEALVLASYLVS